MKNNMLSEGECPAGVIRYNRDVDEIETIIATMHSKHAMPGRVSGYRMEKLTKDMCALVISRRVKRPSYRDFVDGNYSVVLRSTKKYGKLFIVIQVQSGHAEVWGQPTANLQYAGPFYPIKVGSVTLDNLKGWRLF